jgi:hypothetical protein
MVRASRRLLLAPPRLAVELLGHDEAPYLYVRSLLDPAQAFLLPLPTPPAIDGLALSTRLGRWHDLPWALAWGADLPPKGCTVAFSTDTLRFRTTVKAEPAVLDGSCWVAAAEGVFTTAATVVGSVETARVPLAPRY